MELLKKLNIFGSQRKGWLPPAYGKKSYEAMSRKEREVVDAFEGKDPYEKVMVQSSYYLVEEQQLLPQIA